MRWRPIAHAVGDVRGRRARLGGAKAGVQGRRVRATRGESARTIELIVFRSFVFLSVARVRYYRREQTPLPGTRRTAPMVESPELECGRSHTIHHYDTIVSLVAVTLSTRKRKTPHQARSPTAMRGMPRPPTDGRPPKHTHVAAERTPIGRLP